MPLLNVYSNRAATERLWLKNDEAIDAMRLTVIRVFVPRGWNFVASGITIGFSWKLPQMSPFERS